MDLILQPRGMNFYKGCPEKETVTDFDNFRYVAEIIDENKHYYLEITIHWRDSFKRVNAFIEYSEEKSDGMCYRIGVDITEPTKEAVLKAINEKLGFNFNDITFKEE